MKIAFVHFPGRLSRLEPARAGTGPTEFLFGGVELERAGHEVRHYEVDPAAPVSGVARRLVDGNAGRGRLPPHLGAAVLAGTRRLLPALRSAEVVVATTTGTAVALASWKRLGLLRTPLVGIVAGLLNDPWSALRRQATLPLLRVMQLVLYGPGEAPGLQRLGLARRVHVVPFGVDTSYWRPGDDAAGRDVVAIGNDGHRDWDTLVEAAPEIGARVRIFTRAPAPRPLPQNVTWERADWYTAVLTDAEVRELYRNAAVVVVPVRDVPQPSGQSVALQAMATGRPVVLTRTQGLWAPDELRDGDNLVLVPPGRPHELAAAVRGLLDDPARAAALGGSARASVTRDAGVERYADRLLDVCRLALAAG